RDLLRMLYGLHQPTMWRGFARHRLLSQTTYELRLVKERRQHTDAHAVRIFVLAKAFAALEREADQETVRAAVCERVSRALGLVNALAPRELALVPLRSAHDSGDRVNVLDDALGLRDCFSSFAELRRPTYFAQVPPETDYSTFCEAVRQGRLLAIPQRFG